VILCGILTATTEGSAKFYLGGAVIPVRVDVPPPSSAASRYVELSVVREKIELTPLDISRELLP
jgi:hypothetical protein